MEISQITGAGKDPVARAEDDTQLKNIGAIPAVPAVKKDGDSKQSTPEAPSFEHLRQEPLHLLLRAINARLMQTFGATSAPRSWVPTLEQALTPEAVSARVLVLLGTAFERFKIQDANTGPKALLATFLRMANEILNQADHEAREVLSNLNLLDDTVAAGIDKAVALIHAALARFSG